MLTIKRKLTRNKYHRLGFPEDDPIEIEYRDIQSDEIDGMSTIPTQCPRCFYLPPKIRVRDLKTGEITYICHRCRTADPKLRDLPVKPKKIKPNDIDEIINSLPKPNDCDNCQKKNIRDQLIATIDEQNGAVEFLCYSCNNKA